MGLYALPAGAHTRIELPELGELVGPHRGLDELAQAPAGAAASVKTPVGNH